jgi:hypothetical protein
MLLRVRLGKLYVFVCSYLVLNADDILIDLDDMGVSSSPSASGESSSNKIVLHRVTTGFTPKGMHPTLMDH